jgi:hypothetical protein
MVYVGLLPLRLVERGIGVRERLPGDGSDRGQGFGIPAALVT